MFNVPAQYAWLNLLGTLPRMTEEALKLLGTIETPGAGNSPTIMAWAAEVGLARVYTADAIPWCGLFMAVVATERRQGAPALAAVGAVVGQVRGDDGAAAARRCADVRARRWRPCRSIYRRGCRGVHVLGGNQHDCVCFTRIAKARLYRVRRPVYNAAGDRRAAHVLAPGGELSGNEA
jgi:hypothetical protein